jgi:cystathionine beta-lyase/cystathionine gamma-synthase
MRPETIALHAGYDCDPATKAVAVPIYQTVAYSFDSAAHGAALFDLESKASATPASATRRARCSSSASPSSKVGSMHWS